MKLVYSAAVAVRDPNGQAIVNADVLAALSGVSCPGRCVVIPGRDDLQGGHLRLSRDGKRLRLRVEFDRPGNLSRPELAALRKDLAGHIAAELGDGAFDFLADATGLSIGLATGEGDLEQFPGDAWRPGRPSAEAGANDRRCRAAADALRASGGRGRTR